MSEETREKEVVTLFKNIIPVKGYSRSILYDLYMEDYVFISNETYNLLQERNFIFTASELIYFPELQRLLENNFLHLISNDELSLFPELSLYWDHPHEINNIVIEFNLENLEYIIRLSTCKSYCIIFEDYVQFTTNIKRLHDLIVSQKLLTIEVVIRDFKNKEIANFDFKFFNENSKLAFHRVFIFNSAEHSIFRIHETLFVFLNYSQIDEDKDIYQHIVNIKLFTEAQNHNTFYNRKLFIDKDGKIKHTLHSDEVLVNLADVKSFRDLLNLKDLSKYWYISKDQVDVCMDCEFRYMCIDSAIINKRADNTYYRSIECNYNPYISKWDTEEGYMNLTQIGIKCNSVGFNTDDFIFANNS